MDQNCAFTYPRKRVRFLTKASLVASLLVTLFLFRAALSIRAADAHQSFERTRLELQQHGFKTELTNFDLSTPPGSRAREAIIKAAVPKPFNSQLLDHPDLMEAAATNQAIVVWKEKVLRRHSRSAPDGSRDLTWDDFEDGVAHVQAGVNAACAAILSGPVQFNLDASRGESMLLPHLPLLRTLTQVLDDRAILALHRGDCATAWTNLLAATRLVTAWNPEPVEISHRVRFTNTKIIFKATWQALQTNGWTDSQLARLQAEWEATDFLSHLPEIHAFRRAGDLNLVQTDSSAAQISQADLQEDEERLLLFYRDREVEYRNAIAAKSWMQLRAMPGATNETFFELKQRHQLSVQMRLNQRKITARIANLGVSLLAQAAEAEAERRVLITAIALERHHARHQRYPETLRSLAPEFLKSVPTDFMTNQPLHYALTQDGRFSLYSVGLDCVDDGGKIEPPLTSQERSKRLSAPNSEPQYDIVWPLATSSAEVVAFRQEQAQDEEQRRSKIEASEREEEQRRKEETEKSRAAAIKKLLASKPSLGAEPVHQGKPLSAWVMKLGEDEFRGPPDDAVNAIRAIGPKAVPFLLEWMPHPGAERRVEGYPDPSDLEIAWWALGTKGESAIPELARIISRPQPTRDDYSGWTVSANAISYLGPKAILPMLTAATNMQGKHEMWELLHNFGNLGTNGAPAVPALIHWANDPDNMVRDGVVSALGGIGKRADLAVPVLLNALQHDTDSMVRRDAATALGAFANDSDAVLPELIKTLKDPNWEARGGAVSGLGKIQNKPDVVVPLIAPFLYDPNNVLQRTAAYALRDLGSEAGYRAVLQATNAPSSWPGIRDIIYQVQEKSDREKPR